MSEPAQELVLVHTGEVVDLTDENQVALAYREVDQLDRQLMQAKVRLREALAERSKILGTKTFHVPEIGKVEVRGGQETRYDEQTLERELREAGCPEEIIREIIVETVSWKVDGRRASRAAKANPEYAEILERNTQVIEKLPSIVLSKP